MESDKELRKQTSDNKLPCFVKLTKDAFRRKVVSRCTHWGSVIWCRRKASGHQTQKGSLEECECNSYIVTNKVVFVLPLPSIHKKFHRGSLSPGWVGTLQFCCLDCKEAIGILQIIERSFKLPASTRPDANCTDALTCKVSKEFVTKGCRTVPRVAFFAELVFALESRTRDNTPPLLNSIPFSQINCLEENV